MRRREFIALAGGAVAAWPLAAHAQQKAVPVIGFLGMGSTRSSELQKTAVLQGLSDSGFVEGQDFTIEFRGAEGKYDRLPALAAELVDLKVDLLIAQAPPSARAAKKATSTIPIVFGVGSNPVADGLVASLARPGGNLTGVTILATDLTAKRFGLLSELVPDGRVFAILVNPKNPNPLISGLQETARTKGIRLEIVKAATANEIDDAFATIVQLGAEGLVFDDDPFLYHRRKQAAALAVRHRIPSISFLRGFADAGGLISYGPSLADAYHQIGITAGKILKGANPADLPVTQPTRFEMVINLKTADAIGLSISPTTLARADDVIE
jgi:putative ABC transport system substrate-binding protein